MYSCILILVIINSAKKIIYRIPWKCQIQIWKDGGWLGPRKASQPDRPYHGTYFTRPEYSGGKKTDWNDEHIEVWSSSNSWSRSTEVKILGKTYKCFLEVPSIVYQAQEKLELEVIELSKLQATHCVASKLWTVAIKSPAEINNIWTKY